jgi:hypothetical protein
MEALGSRLRGMTALGLYGFSTRIPTCSCYLHSANRSPGSVCAILRNPWRRKAIEPQLKPLYQ